MNQLKNIRLSNKWTQQFVANSIGITKASYSNIENGNRNPSMRVALKIQKLFNQPLEKLFKSD